MKSSSRKKIPVLLLIALLYGIHLLFSTLLIPLRVESASMQPNLDAGNYVLYTPIGVPNKVMSIRKHLSRGSLVVISPPYHRPLNWWPGFVNSLYRFITFNLKDLNHNGESNPYMVRRVVGLPGDTIRITNHIAQIKTKDQNYFTSEFELADQPYEILSQNSTTKDWPQNLPFLGFTEERTLQKNEYFMLADNRNFGNDSSYWGPILLEQIRGQVFFQY